MFSRFRAGLMHVMGLLSLFVLLSTSGLFVATPPALAQSGDTTRVTIRALAHDAKLIGSNVGGARVVIRESATGRVLADGIQQGSTGDTGLIVSNRAKRHETMFNTEGAAHFTTDLVLERPTMVEITAIGPLGNPEATTQSTKRMLLVPGQDVLGEGIIVELNGFSVEWLAPNVVDEMTTGETFTLRASVTMLCGCPTEPGGLWDADDIDVRASFYSGSRIVREMELAFSGETSIYEASGTAPGTGSYRIVVTASDTEHGNFGRTERTLLVN